MRSNYIWTIELSPNTPFCRISPPRSQSGGHSALTLVAGCIRSASTQAPEVRSKRSNRMRGGCFRQCDRRFAGSPGSSSGSPGPTKRTTIQDPCPSQVHPELPIASATRSSRRSMLDISLRSGAPRVSRGLRSAAPPLARSQGWTSTRHGDRPDSSGTIITFPPRMPRSSSRRDCGSPETGNFDFPEI